MSSLVKYGVSIKSALFECAYGSPLKIFLHVFRVFALCMCMSATLMASAFLILVLSEISHCKAIQCYIIVCSFGIYTAFAYLTTLVVLFYVIINNIKT